MAYGAITDERLASNNDRISEWVLGEMGTLVAQLRAAGKNR